MAVSSNSSSTSPPEDLTGVVLGGRYRLERPIASGGMAEVWEGTDETLARRVAVKILHRHMSGDQAFVSRFRHEAIAAARLTHPSIVSVYDTIEDQGLNAIVMELVRGTTMRSDLDAHGPLKLSAALAIGSQVADALGAAHASGLVHRDVKPANILLSRDGRVLVADFGIAKATEGADLTSEGSMVGTVKYLAPEQVEGTAVDGRTDLYALGVVLYEALTGRAPFLADTDAGTALARLHRDPTPPRQLRPDLPVAVEQVLMLAMARRPEDRFANAGAMRRALLAAGADPTRAPAAVQAAVAGAPSRPVAGATMAPPPPAPPHSAPPSTPPPSSPPPDSPARRRSGWPLALAIVVVLGAMAAAIAVFPRDGGDPPGSRLALSDVVDFDPGGDGDQRENPEQLDALRDDDPTTAWSTERYRTADVQTYKGGVGLVASLDQATELAGADLETPRGGWNAEIYLVDGAPAARLEEWGEPIASVEDAPTGSVTIDLAGRRGSSVLIWFTRLAADGDRFSVQIGSIDLRGP